MEVTISKQLQQFVNDQVESGAYATAQDVVCAAIAAFKQQHDRATDDFEPGELDAILAERGDADEGEMSLDDAIRLRREERARRLRKGA